MEKIRVLKEKYGTENEIELENECEYSSLVITEEIEITEEVDTKFSDINNELSPCIEELYKIQKEIDSLKRKFKTPFEYIEQEKEYKEEEHNTIQELNDERHAVSLHLARIANERDIQHMVRDTKGHQYVLPNIVREVDQFGKERFKARVKKKRGVVECGVREGLFIRVKVMSESDNSITIAGIDFMKQLCLSRTDLQPCIDTIKTQEKENLDLAGERVLALCRDNIRTLTRVVFVHGVKGFHLSWYIGMELGI